MAGDLSLIEMKEFMKNWILPPGFFSLLSNLMISNKKTPEKSLTDEEKELLNKNEAIRDRHRGDRCFILGGGSSISNQDLKKLVGEYVISVSNTFVHPDYHIFRPKYHVLPPIVSYHGDLNSLDKYVVWLREMEAKTFDAEFFFHIGDRQLIASNHLFRNRKIYWSEFYPWDGSPVTTVDISNVPEIRSVSEFAITVALYLGFEKIYLLGFDHDWFNGLFVYFYDHNTEHAVKPDMSKLTFADSEFQMRRHAEMFKKYKYLYGIKKNIYNANANPNSYVDIFPKVDFDSLFKGENSCSDKSLDSKALMDDV